MRSTSSHPLFLDALGLLGVPFAYLGAWVIESVQRGKEMRRIVAQALLQSLFRRLLGLDVERGVNAQPFAHRFRSVSLLQELPNFSHKVGAAV